MPSGISLVTLLERNAGRARSLQTLLDAILPKHAAKPTIAQHAVATDQIERLRSAGAQSRTKPHIFGAMPFAPEFDDHFHYGIQQAVNAAGYLCERADLATFAGDVITWVKERIDTCLLAADLSTANPNMYLEVGYAWGKGIPTVLLARDATDLDGNVPVLTMRSLGLRGDRLVSLVNGAEPATGRTFRIGVLQRHGEWPLQ